MQGQAAPEYKARMRVRLQKGFAFFVARYGLVVVANAIVTRLTLKLEFLAEAPFVLFFAVAIVSTVYGGIGPGLFSTALSAFLVAFCFIAPFFEVSLDGKPEHTLQLALYVMVSGMSCAFLAGWKRKLEHFHDEAAECRDIAETAPEGVFLLDENERIIYANEISRKLFAEPREELIGRKLDFAVPRELYEPQLQVLRESLNTRRQPDPIRFALQRGRGGAIHLELRLRTFSRRGQAMFAAWFHPVEKPA
jgi:PAS domain S-box-containing protein